MADAWLLTDEQNSGLTEETSLAPTRALVAGCSSRSSWSQVEDRFLSVMWSLDQAPAAGRARQAGNFFTSLIEVLLESCSGKKLRGRAAMPGLIFSNHYVRASYPQKGTVEILIDTKVVGAPKSPYRQDQKIPQVRSGGSDLDRWIKEAGLKTIDLKAEWARNAGQGGGPTSDLVTWLRQSKPLSFLFLAVRVADRKDLERTLSFANAANQMVDAVGLVTYEPNSFGTGYQACKVYHHLELDRVLSRVCTVLRNLP